MHPSSGGRPRSPFPRNSMMWAVDDRAIEQSPLRVAALEDICRAGFDGVTVFVRGGRYVWSDPAAVAALAHIGELCASMGMTYWLGADPRFISRLIVRGQGKRMVVSGESTVPERVPLSVPVRKGRFNARCRIRKRVVHTMNEAAVTFHPLGVAHARLVDGTTGETRDITRDTVFFHNAKEDYVEAFGQVTVPHGARSRVLVYFLFETNHFDYDSKRQLGAYVDALLALPVQGVAPAMVVWDEPGYPCRDGCYPVGRSDDFLAALGEGKPAGPDLPFEPGHGAIEYHAAIQEEIIRARAWCNRALADSAVTFRIEGIHDTWRWESADSGDRLHGSLDLWKSNAGNRAAFVDLGSVQLLRDPRSGFYANLAGISAAALGLGRQASRHIVYNNLWTVGEDRRQRGVMDQCVNVLALFGTRWIGHIYGPAGIVGARDSFLGLDVTPGYPNHSTWAGMAEWTARLDSHLDAVGRRLPTPDVLMRFPVRTLSVLDKSSADRVFAELFRLVLFLVDHHLTVALTSISARPAGGLDRETPFMVVPFPLDRKDTSAARLMRRGHTVMLYRHERGEEEHANTPAVKSAQAPDELLSNLRDAGLRREVIAPPGSWVTRTRIRDGHIVTLVPSRYGLRYSGTLEFRGEPVKVPPHDGLCRVLFDSAGAFVRMERW